jgi:hypothetical protein
MSIADRGATGMVIVFVSHQRVPASLNASLGGCVPPTVPGQQELRLASKFTLLAALMINASRHFAVKASITAADAKNPDLTSQLHSDKKVTSRILLTEFPEIPTFMSVNFC